VIIDNAELKLKPTTDSPVIKKLPLGSSFDAIENIGDYMKIKLPPNQEGIAISGYILLDFIEIEQGSTSSAKPPDKKYVEFPAPSKVSTSTMDYTDWKLKLEKAKDSRSAGIVFLGGGLLLLAVTAIRGQDFGPTVKTSSLLSSTLFSLSGIAFLISGSEKISELEEQGRRQGYLVSLNILPTYKQKTAGFPISCAISF
jgi:hypothetical protein